MIYKVPRQIVFKKTNVKQNLWSTWTSKLNTSTNDSWSLYIAKLLMPVVTLMLTPLMESFPFRFRDEHNYSFNY